MAICALAPLSHREMLTVVDASAEKAVTAMVAARVNASAATFRILFMMVSMRAAGPRLRLMRRLMQRCIRERGGFGLAVDQAPRLRSRKGDQPLRSALRSLASSATVSGGGEMPAPIMRRPRT